MCGVAGVFHADPARPVEPSYLVRMAAIQQHRGPDGFGLRRMDDRGIGFSHARLSIIDLDEDRARQPFASSDGQLLLTHNGEFYDYQRLRADLTARGARFRTKSDSELVLHLYPRLGLDGMLEHLRGEFAFALYDRREDRLILVRDRFGVRPLYWTMAGGDLVFGSEIKVLFAHPDVPRRFSDQGVFHELMQTKVPGQTAFEGVHAVEPGCAIVVSRNQGALSVRKHTYWDIDYPQEGSRPDRPDEYYVEQVRAHLLEAVQLRLEADVPVGCYLSGGIDSSAILGLASAARQTPVKAFTIGFDDAAYDETSIARGMADAVGADQEVLPVDTGQLYEHFERTIWHAETSIYNTFCIAKVLMSDFVHARDYKVMITGEGADELFAGYPALRRDMILHGSGIADGERAELAAQLAESNALFSGSLLARRELIDDALTDLIGFTPSSLQPWLACAAHVPALLHGDRRKRLAGYQPGRAIAETLDPDMLRGRHALDKAQYVWTKTQFERQVIGWAGDRVDMANSVETRPAFLDHHLAEFATRVPPRMRIRGNREKFVLREAVAGLLPRELYEREKFAFMAPPAHRDRERFEALRGLTTEHLSLQTIENAGVLDADGVRQVIEEYDSGKSDPARKTQLDAMVNHLLSVQLLHQQLIRDDVSRKAQAIADRNGWRVPVKSAA